MANKIINLTGPPKKAGKRIRTQSPDVIITGHEEQVDSLIESKSEMDNWKDLMENVRVNLEALASDARLNAEASGIFNRKVVLRGSEKDIKMSFGNAFSKIDTKSIPEIKGALGKHFEKLFMEHEEASVIPSQITKLVDLITAAGHDPDEFLEMNKYLGPVPEFRERRFELREKMTDSQNQAADTIAEQAGYRPSLSVPK